MSPISGPLAFYLAHPAEMTELAALPQPPDGVSEDDWSLFREVHARAALAAATLLRRALTDGLVALERHGRKAYRSDPKTDEWNTWARFDRTGWAPSNRPVYVGVSLEYEPEQSAVFMVSYISTAGDNRPLFTALKSVWSNDAGEGSLDGQDDHVQLARLALKPETDLDLAFEQSKLAFKELSRAWDTFAAPAAGSP